MYFKESAGKVLTVENKRLTSLKFAAKSSIDFSLFALFRLEPHFGRFPESQEAKEKVIRSQYGRPLRPGIKCSLRHVLTNSYLAKSCKDRDGTFRACLQREESEASHSPRLPDMSVTVVSAQAWEDEGVLDGSQVLIAITELGHNYLFDVEKNPFSGAEAVFRFTHEDLQVITVHSYLYWRDINERSAKYGFVCQLKASNSMFLTARPNLQNSACLQLLTKPRGQGLLREQDYCDDTVLPEYWGDVAVDLTTDESDGNSFWVMEQVKEEDDWHFHGGVVCGDHHFRLKHVLTCKYFGADFTLANADSAQVMTFPYSGENSPERKLERLKSGEEECAEEDVVEMFEQYPLLKARCAETAASLVGHRYTSSPEDVWGRLLQPFAWRLAHDSAVRQGLSYISSCTPDKLLKFEVRETELRTAAKVLEIADKVQRFVEFHKAIEDPEKFKFADDSDPSRRTLSTMRITDIRASVDTEEEEEEAAISGLGDLQAAQSLHAGQYPELRVLKSLLTRVSKARELKLMMDAQVTTEILRLLVLIISGESRIDPNVKLIIESSFKDFLFRSKLVWNRLYTSRFLLEYLALNYTALFLQVLESTKEYLPSRPNPIIASAISAESPGLSEVLDPDRQMHPKQDSDRTVTELLTTHFSEVDSDSFADRFPALVRAFSLTEAEVLEEIEEWSDLTKRYKNLKESARHVDWLTARIDKRQASGSLIQKLMAPILELFDFLVDVTIPEVDCVATTHAREYDRETHFDQEDVKQFVQSAFRLIATYQYWVDFHALQYYHSHRSITYSELEKYISRRLTLGNLASAESISFAQVLKNLPKKDLETPLLDPAIEAKVTECSGRPPVSLAGLLVKIAKFTRYRVQDDPSALLKMIDKAIQPAQSAALFIERLCQKEAFKEVIAKVKAVRTAGRFYAEVGVAPREGSIAAGCREAFKQYVKALQDLLSTLELTPAESRKGVQSCLCCAGFGMELRRMWTYSELLGDSEDGAQELRTVTFALSRHFVVDNPKQMKEVFRLLTERTFNFAHPEYLSLLYEMNVLPHDDDVLKQLIHAIAGTHDDTAYPAILMLKKTFGLKEATLRALLPAGREELAVDSRPPQNDQQIAKSIMNLTAALIERSLAKSHFTYPRSIRASISQLFSQQERQAHLLISMLKNVYLTDNLVKKYLQAWRYLILSYHAVLRFSVAVGAKRKVPGLPVGKRKTKTATLTTLNVLADSDPEMQSIVHALSPEEHELLFNMEFHLLSKNDIRGLEKQWQGNMQSLMERIVDYVCRSSNTPIQKEELQVLAEIVKNDDAAKQQVIEVLGRNRQYRHFFGLCRTAVERTSHSSAKDVERKETVELVTAFLAFFQAACDGCFSPFQKYLREQNDGQHDNVDLVDVLARKLEDLVVDSVMLDELDSTLASELAVTLLEAASGPCIDNIQAICRYPRLLRGISVFVSRAVVAPEVQCKLDAVLKREKKRHRSSPSGEAAMPGLTDFIRTRFASQQQQTVFSDPRLMIIMGKLYVKEKKKEVNRSAEDGGLRYPGVRPCLLELCARLVNLMIALLEGNERRPQKIVQLMPSVNFKKFETVSERLTAGLDEEFFRRFEAGVLQLEDYQQSRVQRQFASPGAVMNFAMRCFILYCTSLPEDDLPDSRSRLLKYIGSVEIQQPGPDASSPEIHSVIFQVPFKALHLSFLDTEIVLDGLSSSSREENLKLFVGQLDTYLGEMKFLQKLAQSRTQNYFRMRWKQVFWMCYAVLVAINVLLVAAFDDFEQVGYEVDWKYHTLLVLFGLVHCALRTVWTISYYMRFWHLIWYPLTGFESANHLWTLAHTSKPGTMKAFFSMNLSRSHSVVRVQGVLRMLGNFALVPVSIVAISKPWVFPFLLMEICSMESTLVNIIKAITNRYKQLMLTFAFAMLLMYVYAVLGFFWKEACMDVTPTLYDYVISVFYHGMREDTGIAAVLQDPQDFTFRFFFDMSFYILITTILMAIVFGIVVDTFGELRDEMNEAERNMTSSCSICRQPRSSIEIRGEGWDRHCLLTHNPFAYLYFMAYVKEKDINDCSGVEKYVRQQLDHRDIGFFPTSFRERVGEKRES